MFACFVGFSVVGTQKAHWGEACGRGGWAECQAGGKEGKILGNKSVILNCIVQEPLLHLGCIN